MRKIDFTKMVASGNDFIVIANNLRSGRLSGQRTLAKNICHRKYGIGADGLLLLGKSRVADVKMRIFNPDGSEPAMCGNGVRCIALYAKSQTPNLKSRIKIETKAGIIESRVDGGSVRVRLTEPRGWKLNLPIKMKNRTLRVNFINTGVPHTVIFVADLDKIDVVNLGRQIRFHKRFAPCGTNVDFVEFLDNKSIKIRTYERGVEEETLACGTGAVASALITGHGLGVGGYGKINVQVRSGEILKVYFEKRGDKFRDVWLEGKVRTVYKGVYYA